MAETAPHFAIVDNPDKLSARDRGLRVIPVCPFLAAYIKRHLEEQDMLEPSWRDKLALA